jgi:hypothetical protein
MMLD